MNRMTFEVVFKSGNRTVATVEGQREVEAQHMTVHELGVQVPEAEQFLEKLTGLRVHINVVRS